MFIAFQNTLSTKADQNIQKYYIIIIVFKEYDLSEYTLRGWNVISNIKTKTLSNVHGNFREG